MRYRAIYAALVMLDARWLPLPVRIVITKLLVRLAFWWSDRGQRLYNLWKYRVTRVTLALTPCPVTVHYRLFCCDTGYFETQHTYRRGWPAFKRTRYDELSASSDGPASYWTEKHWMDGEFRL